MPSNLEELLLVRLTTLRKQHTLFAHMDTAELTPIRNHAPFAHNDMEFDFCWPNFKIAIEVQGGIDIRTRRSGHLNHAGIRRDMYKLNLAQIHGWMLFQFPPEICKDDDYWQKYGLFFLIKAFRQRLSSK